MRRRLLVCSLTALVASCTLLTEAGDRETVERLDLDFTLYRMSEAHPNAEPLDVALVALQADGQQALRARARVVIAKPGESEGSEHIVLSNVIENEPLRVLFYVDHDPENLRYDNGEHVWQQDVPASGELSFTHFNKFSAFDQDLPMPIGGDVVFELPLLAQTAFGTACFNARVQKSLEIRVLYDVLPGGANIQVGYYKTYRGNGVPPSAIRLKGIAELGSMHAIEVTVDGVTSPRTLVGPPNQQGVLSVPFETWFPVDEASREPCLGMR